MRKDLKVVYEFELRTNNRHSCMEYMEGLAHDVTYLLWNCICGKMKRAAILHFRLYWSLPQKAKNCIVVVKLMETKFLIFLNFFNVILKGFFPSFFDVIFSMFYLSILCLFYIFVFLCFVVLCFIIDPN